MDLWPLDTDHLEVAVRVGGALLVGGAIGLERSYHGRAAGFRTHALVALSTSLLMVVPIFGSKWLPQMMAGHVTIDPTRMAQGIMTGIGFLGAGAILRDGLSIRGLTTAASIWVTAAIGILMGTGFYFPAVLATLFTLGTLSVFRWIESFIPAKFYAHLLVRFRRAETLSEDELRALISRHGFRMSGMNYRLDAAAGVFEYRMVVTASRAARARALTETLNHLPGLDEYSISPTAE